MATTDEENVYGLARVFFNAATKQSDDSEDILPQEVWAQRSPSLPFWDRMLPPRPARAIGV